MRANYWMIVCFLIGLVFGFVLGTGYERSQHRLDIQAPGFRMQSR